MTITMMSNPRTLLPHEERAPPPTPPGAGPRGHTPHVTMVELLTLPYDLVGTAPPVPLMTAADWTRWRGEMPWYTADACTPDPQRTLMDIGRMIWDAAFVLSGKQYRWARLVTVAALWNRDARLGHHLGGDGGERLARCNRIVDLLEAVLMPDAAMPAALRT
jgi:hypothetical protein